MLLQRGLPENDARWLFQQIALAVDFCHRLGIALRDIKVRPLQECWVQPVGFCTLLLQAADLQAASWPVRCLAACNQWLYSLVLECVLRGARQHASFSCHVNLYRLILTRRCIHVPAVGQLPDRCDAGGAAGEALRLWVLKVGASGIGLQDRLRHA